MDNYMTPTELREVANYCEALQPLWDALTNGPMNGIRVEDLHGIRLSVYDSNGETLGRITWADGGPAFFPGDDDA